MLVWGVLDQWLIVFVNDVADEKADAENHDPSFVSGGSRVLVEGKLSRRALARAAWAVGLSLGVYSVAVATWMEREWLPLGWLATVTLIWGYSLHPLRLSYRGGGEFLSAIGMGGVLPTLGFYAQAGTLSGLEPLALGGVTVLALGANITTALPDEPADRRAEKNSIAVLLGPKRARLASLIAYLGGAVLMLLTFPTAQLLPGLALALPAMGLLSFNLPATWREGPTTRRFVLGNLALFAWLLGGWSMLIVIA